MLSKTSVDEVFMHYFEKMSASFAPRPPLGSCPWTLLGDFRPSDPLIAHPGKILQVPMDYRDIVSSGNVLTDGRTAGQPENMMLSTYYCR